MKRLTLLLCFLLAITCYAEKINNLVAVANLDGTFSLNGELYSKYKIKEVSLIPDNGEGQPIGDPIDLLDDKNIKSTADGDFITTFRKVSCPVAIYKLKIVFNAGMGEYTFEKNIGKQYVFKVGNGIVFMAAILVLVTYTV